MRTIVPVIMMSNLLLFKTSICICLVLNADSVMLLQFPLHVTRQWHCYVVLRAIRQIWFEQEKQITAMTIIKLAPLTHYPRIVRFCCQKHGNGAKGEQGAAAPKPSQATAYQIWKF